MRLSFNSLGIQGTVIIGEGAKDKAPMLYNGETVGDGDGPVVDVAVDPVEGTRLLAKMCIRDRGHMAGYDGHEAAPCLC